MSSPAPRRGAASAPGARASADVLDAEHVDEEVAQLVRPGGEVVGLPAPHRIVVKQLGIFELDHRRTGAGRRNDHLRSGKGANRVAGQLTGVVVEATIEVR